MDSHCTSLLRVADAFIWPKESRHRTDVPPRGRNRVRTPLPMNEQALFIMAQVLFVLVTACFAHRTRVSCKKMVDALNEKKNDPVAKEADPLLWAELNDLRLALNRSLLSQNKWARFIAKKLQLKEAVLPPEGPSPEGQGTQAISERRVRSLHSLSQQSKRSPQ